MPEPTPVQDKPDAAASSEAQVVKLQARVAELELEVQKKNTRIKELKDGALRTGMRKLRKKAWQRFDDWILDGFLHRPGKLFQHEPVPMKTEVFPRGTLPDAKLPSLHIVTPSYNQARFLERTIKSVLDQKYPRLSYIINDGASKDDSVAVIQKYADRLTSWVSKPDGGQAAAVRAGFTENGGEIMAWLNSDDTLLPGALRFVGEYFARHPEVDAVYGHRVLIDEEDREIGRWVMPWYTPEPLRWFDHVPQETLFWRRSLYDRVGGMDPQFQFALDWDLLLRFQEAGARIVRLPYFIGCFRVHEAQKTRAEISSRGMMEMTAIRKRIHGREIEKIEHRGIRWRERRRSAIVGKLLQWGIRL